MLKRIGFIMALTIFCCAPVCAAIFDDAAVDKFSSLNDEQVTRAAALKIMLRHASVGQCISQGLDSLYEQNIMYDRTNFAFQARGNPGWRAKIRDFTDQVREQAADFDAFNMKFCYIDTDASAAAYIEAMEDLEANYPNKLFVWWTMPLTASGSAQTRAFNKAVRNYTKEHNKVLFDIAAIESHHEDGSPCVRNGLECLCPEYTQDGGHPNRAASLRLAKAYWVLADRLSDMVK